MKKSYFDSGGNDTELIAILNAISHVSARMARNMTILAQQRQSEKSRFDELLTDYIEKPQGKPTLVPESDKRPAMNNAKTDFMEEN